MSTARRCAVTSPPDRPDGRGTDNSRGTGLDPDDDIGKTRPRSAYPPGSPCVAARGQPSSLGAGVRRTTPTRPTRWSPPSTATPITEGDLALAGAGVRPSSSPRSRRPAALRAARPRHRHPPCRQGGRRRRASTRSRMAPRSSTFARDRTLRSEYLQRAGSSPRVTEDAVKKRFDEETRQVRRRRRSPRPSHPRARPRTRPRRSSPSSTRAATSPRSPRRSRWIPARASRAATSASSSEGRW